MFKYIYQPKRQGSSWIGSIRDARDKITSLKLKTTEHDRYTPLIMKTMVWEGAREAEKDIFRETRIDANHMMENTVIDNWLDFDKLIYTDYLETFMVSRAQTQEAKRFLGV